MNKIVTEAISVLKLYRNDWSLGSQNNERLNKAIDTVVKELEKPLPTDEQMKERGNLTFRVMLRQLNCKHEKNNVTISVKELEHWFETWQHLKEWKELDTL
jgi:hypothetical protein